MFEHCYLKCVIAKLQPVRLILSVATHFKLLFRYDVIYEVHIYQYCRSITVHTDISISITQLLEPQLELNT